MPEIANQVKLEKLECCPTLAQKENCDVFDFRYRLPSRARVGDGNNQVVPVDIILHFRLERCSGPLVLGDLAYTTTLLPGEQVRLFSSDRHTRWSYDSENNLTYRHETTSEESFFTYGMAEAMSDLTVNQSGRSVSSFEESYAQGGGGASVNLFGLVEIGGGGGGGSYDAVSVRDFSQSLSSHAESSVRQVAAGVRAKSSTAIGEVEQRQHAEGESETQIESASRVFSNPNRCHAVTFLFYKIAKVQRIRFRLVAVERQVRDPSAPVEATPRDKIDAAGLVGVKAQNVLATSNKRLEVERIARESALERQGLRRDLSAGPSGASLRFAPRASLFEAEPIAINLRQAALKAVDNDLVKAGMLDRETLKPTERMVAELSFEREECLPTPGVIVRGCIDDCNICEPALLQEVELEIDRNRLENEMLRRQIELLDKAQEYRCCPEGNTDEPS